MVRISLIFSTQDNIIQTSLVCYPNDKFSDVVNKIYEKEEYHEYKNKHNIIYLTANKLKKIEL